MNVKRKILD